MPIVLDDGREEVALQIDRFAGQQLTRRKHPPGGNVCYTIPIHFEIHRFERKQINKIGIVRECPRQGAIKKINATLRRIGSPWIVWFNDRAHTHGLNRYKVKSNFAHMVEEDRRGKVRHLRLVDQKRQRIQSIIDSGRIEDAPLLLREFRELTLLQDLIQSSSQRIQAGEQLRLL